MNFYVGSLSILKISILENQSREIDFLKLFLYKLKLGAKRLRFLCFFYNLWLDFGSIAYYKCLYFVVRITKCIIFMNNYIKHILPTFRWLPVAFATAYNILKAIIFSLGIHTTSGFILYPIDFNSFFFFFFTFTFLSSIWGWPLWS